MGVVNGLARQYMSEQLAKLGVLFSEASYRTITMLSDFIEDHGMVDQFHDWFDERVTQEEKDEQDASSLRG